MARILRGDIFWANHNPTIGNEQAGFRPVLIISEEIFNKRLGTITSWVKENQNKIEDAWGRRFSA
jgi:mRNA interferase MazF